jgi:hypothetical protein
MIKTMGHKMEPAEKLKDRLSMPNKERLTGSLPRLLSSENILGPITSAIRVLPINTLAKTTRSLLSLLKCRM